MHPFSQLGIPVLRISKISYPNRNKQQTIQIMQTKNYR